MNSRRRTSDKQPVPRRLAALTAAALILLVVSCQGDRSATSRSTPSSPAAVSSANESSEKSAQDTEMFHSPFVVSLQGGTFDTVTFKDVGLPREEDGPDQMLLEAISESFAQQIAQRSDFSYEANVVYDVEVTEPANHLHCERNHLYIDLWQGTSPERWGYSLWSGCTERHNFAWREIPAKGDDDEIAEWVAPLTKGIIDELADASERGCFQKSC